MLVQVQASSVGSLVFPALVALALALLWGADLASLALALDQAMDQGSLDRAIQAAELRGLYRVLLVGVRGNLDRAIQAAKLRGLYRELLKGGQKQEQQNPVNPA